MNDSLKKFFVIPRERKFFLTLLFLFCLLFSLTIFLLPWLKQVSKRSPLFILPVNAPVTYENEGHCLRMNANTVECAKNHRVAADPPKDLYTVPWTYVDVPAVPLSIPLPKTYSINRGYEKNTIDLYTSNNRGDHMYFGLFIDQPCKQFSYCQTQLTFDPFHAKVEHLDSFFDPEQRILVRQIKATHTTGEVRYFFTIHYDGMSRAIQYYPDTDIKNLEAAWKAISFIRIRPLSDGQELREQTAFSKLIDESSKSVPQEWDYRTVQNLPFQLKLPSYHASTRESVRMNIDDDAESMEESYTISFTSLPDASFKGPIATVTIFTLRGMTAKKTFLLQCPQMLNEENWQTINDMRVFGAQNKCQTYQYIYDYQGIYYLIGFQGSNAPYIYSMLEQPKPLMNDEGRRYFSSLVGNIPVKLTYDPVFLKAPVKEASNTYRFYTQNGNSSIDMTFISHRTNDVTELNMYKAIVDKDFCNTAETGSLMVHTCKYLPISRYNAYTFYGAVKPPHSVGNYSLLGKMFAIRTDRSGWPLIIVKTFPENLPRAVRYHESQQDMRKGLSNFAIQFAQDPLLLEMDKIIADFSLSNR